MFKTHEVLDKPNNAHSGEEVEKIKYRVKLDNEIEQIRIKQEQQVTFKDMRFQFPIFLEFSEVLQVVKGVTKAIKLLQEEKKEVKQQ